VTCFSDSASFLTVLAPGALITAAGIQEAGTSQATPHVAGAVAVMKSAYPNYAGAKVISSLRTGPQILDPKSRVSTPRLDLTRFLPRPAFPNDFNGDGNTDLLWQYTDGRAAMWLMNGTAVLSSAEFGPYPGWNVLSGEGDFNGDGKRDLVWMNSNGAVSIWLMNGTMMLSKATFGPYAGWTLASASSDFNGDGKSDLLWKNTNGAVAIWLMDGTTVLSTAMYGRTRAGRF